ncbi:DNA-3-methyladenine glycosylase I [Nigerium massiliense]|uniref:DNA-3-methyladenine glycosylase I n=1 Tax=Nigerium massiliense TaxID=1522317 RepID=UPI00069499BC|nr:DNA-3-methyladenine glycosylase I [Nigerium massiliense]
MNRPAWAETNDLLRDYYDNEWGLPVRDAQGVYERIVLEGFQSGLSWETVLRKRPAFRAAFSGFDPAAVAAFTERDVERLLADPGIVRNRRKIEAAITNARATVRLSEDGDDLGALVWSFRPDDPTRQGDGTDAAATTSPESVALAKELKRRGFVFVGPVTMYALMQAIGILEHRR